MKTWNVVAISWLVVGCSEVAEELPSPTDDGVCPFGAPGGGFWRAWAGVEDPVVAAQVRGCDGVVVTVAPTGTPSLRPWSADAGAFGEPVPLPALGRVPSFEGVPVSGLSAWTPDLQIALRAEGGGALCRRSKVVVLPAGAAAVEVHEILGTDPLCAALGVDARGALIVSYSAIGGDGLYIPQLARLDGGGTWTKLALPEHWSRAVSWIATDAGGRTYVGGPGWPPRVARLEAVGGDELFELDLASTSSRAVAVGLCEGGQILLDLAPTDAEAAYGCLDPETRDMAALPALPPEDGRFLADAVGEAPDGISLLELRGPPALPALGPVLSRLLAFDARSGTWWAPAGEETLVSPSGWGPPRLLGLDGDGRPVALAEGRLWVGRAFR